MPRLRATFDGGADFRLDLQMAAQHLHDAGFLHAHFQIDGRDLEGRRIGRIVHVYGNRLRGFRQNLVQTAGLLQLRLAILRRLEQVVPVEVGEDRLRLHDLADARKLDIGHVAVGSGRDDHQIDDGFVDGGQRHGDPSVGMTLTLGMRRQGFKEIPGRR